MVRYYEIVVIITGDLNFHLDDPSDHNARKFLDILDEQGFVQHVVGATHIRGYTLDFFITRDNSSKFTSIMITRVIKMEI
jgi:hypothetical protein